MNDILKPVERFIGYLSPREFRRYIAIYISSILLIATALIYWHYRKLDDLKKRIVNANKQRIEVQNILSLKEEVERQKNVVKQALKKRQPSFRLLQYFEHTINKLQLQNNLKKTAVQVGSLEHLRSQGYSEVIVEAGLINLNTKQLVELLDEIEKNTIIYIKYLEITKSGKAPVIDLILKIATLQLDKDEVSV